MATLFSKRSCFSHFSLSPISHTLTYHCFLKLFCTSPTLSCNFALIVHISTLDTTPNNYKEPKQNKQADNNTAENNWNYGSRMHFHRYRYLIKPPLTNFFVIDTNWEQEAHVESISQCLLQLPFNNGNRSWLAGHDNLCSM